ncbi:MAG: helix-turn-helix domain-containing protein [Lachnospiraceae bacterium]|nr:helix-turn-helix domain-containing protein [Lachnospiraceae bacterium]
MEIYGIGQRIREERIRQKLSQEDLSYGICAISTLSRLENGVQKPSLKVQEALLERLGCSTENLVFFAHEDEVRKHFLEVDMGYHLMNHDMDLQDELEEYEKLMLEKDMGSNLEKQYYLMVKSMYDLRVKGSSREQAYAMLKQALLLTMPDFKVKDLYAIRLMTLTEINILNNMAVMLYEMKSTGLAIKYMYFLVDYLERSNLSKDILAKRYPLLLVNLAKLEMKIGDFRQSFSWCQKGIAFCSECGKLVPLAALYYYKAVAYAKFGGMRKALECYEYAICLYNVGGKNELAAQIEQEYQNVITYNKYRKVFRHDQPADKDLHKPEEEQRTKSDQPV